MMGIICRTEPEENPRNNWQEQPSDYRLVEDPSGDFPEDARFTRYDLLAGCKPSTRVWDYGTVFENVRTGMRWIVGKPIRYRHGYAKLIRI